MTLLLLALGRLVAEDSSFRLSSRVQLAWTRRSLRGLRLWVYLPKPRVLVVGGNERQRRHHHKFEQLARDWGFDGEWLMANYTSPQKLVSTIGEVSSADLCTSLPAPRASSASASEGRQGEIGEVG